MSKGFFEAAISENPKPQTVAIVAIYPYEKAKQASTRPPAGEIAKGQ